MTTPKWADYLAGDIQGQPTLDMNMRLLACLAAIASGTNPDGTNVPGAIAAIASADALEASSGNLAATAGSATLTSAAGRTAYISGFEITGGGATAGSIVTATITGLTNTLTYLLAPPTGAAVGMTPLVVEFTNPIPASGLNTNIVVNIPSFGAGNTNACVSAHGFLL